MVLRQATILWCIVMWTVVVVSGIAPDDASQFAEFCNSSRRLNDAVMTPVYKPSMKPLMDSWNYRNLLPTRVGAVWDQVDLDSNNEAGLTTNWIQNSNNDCQQTVLVCGFTAGAQKNWLITQLIRRTAPDGTLLPRVSVLLEVVQLECDVTLDCQRTFNTHVYETSTENATAARNVNNYRNIRRVATTDTSGNRTNETVVIDFQTNERSFYFVVEDESSCIVIARILVFYTVCPRQTANLISYPEKIATSESASETISAECVENAVPVNGESVSLTCSANGNWITLSGCVCRKGYVNNSGTCTPCPAGTYLSPSNGSCLTCPANSFSVQEGLAMCNCTDGYYRLLTTEEDLPCRLPPPPPVNLQLVSRTENTITILWERPQFDGEFEYEVHYQLIDMRQSRVLYGRQTTTRVEIAGLASGRTYTISVTSENDITDQVDFSAKAVSIEVTTAGSAGSSSNVAVIVPTIIVLLVVAAIVVSTAIFIYILYRKWYTESGLSLVSQYHDAVEFSEHGATSCKMYVDPALYATPDQAVHDFAQELAPKTLRLQEEIGRGEFGAVYKGVWKQTGKQTPIAIKTLKPNSSTKQRGDFLSEASIMGQFNHPHVIKLYGVVTKVEPVMIIMEFMDNGSLLHYLRKNDEKLGIPRLIKLSRGVASGMDYLSTIGFVHRDLAARNVLVSKNEVPKVADFGLSRETVDEIYKVNTGGKIPVRWTAPEAIYRRKFTSSSDVWSFGVLLWEVMSYSQTPYDGMDNQELLDKLEDGYRLEKPNKTPDEVYQIMLDCWNDENTKRPKFKDIVQKLDNIVNDKATSNKKAQTKNYMYSSTVTMSPLDFDSVDGWLKGLKMDKYIPTFEKNSITSTNAVLELTEEDLKEMGVVLAGHVSKICRSIAIGKMTIGKQQSVRV